MNRAERAKHRGIDLGRNHSHRAIGHHYCHTGRSFASKSGDRVKIRLARAANGRPASHDPGTGKFSAPQHHNSVARSVSDFRGSSNGVVAENAGPRIASRIPGGDLVSGGFDPRHANKMGQGEVLEGISLPPQAIIRGIEEFRYDPGAVLQILLVSPRFADVEFVVNILVADKRKDLLHPTVMCLQVVSFADFMDANQLACGMCLNEPLAE